MKPNKLLKTALTAIAVLFLTKVNATILIVDGNVGGAGQYTQISTAIAAASAGDTLYVSGAGANYADFTIDKSLALIGPGSYRQTQTVTRAKVNNVDIASGVSNVTFSGFWVNNTIEFLSNNSQILLENNFIQSMELNNNLGFISLNNNIFNLITSSVGCVTVTGLSNLSFKHCIFNGQIYPFQLSNSVIDHCFFHRPTTNFYAFSTACNNGATVQLLTIKNSIFYNSNPLPNVDTAQCIFQNNITYSSSTPYSNLPNTGGSSGNINNTNPQLMNYPTAGAAFVNGQDYHLNPASPGHNAATDGTDIGIYGGGIPATTTGEVYGMPVIRIMDIMNNSVPQNGNVNVKVRSTKPRENQ